MIIISRVITRTTPFPLNILFYWNETFWWETFRWKSLHLNDSTQQGSSNFICFFSYWCMCFVMTAQHVSHITRGFELPFILPFCIVFGFCSTHLGKHHFNIIWQLLFIFRTLNVSVSAFVLLCHRGNTCTQMRAYSETRTHFIVSTLFFLQ